MSATPTDVSQRAVAGSSFVSSAAPTVSRWYVFKLGVMAVSGVTIYNVVLIAPFVLLMRFNPWSGYYGIWPILGVVAFFWWAMRPFHETPGTPVSRDQAPGLFEDVEQLAEQIGAPRIDEIRLADDFNASAMNAPVRWQPWRKRRVLMLGVPLLALTDVATAKSVIAHELGHFSHRHGRLGHWVYRAREAWVSYAGEPLDSVSLYERGAAFFAQWFAPRFSKLAFNYSRLCEYEADAYGASIVGKVPMASGLLTIATFGRRWRDMAAKELPRLVVQQDAPPPAWIAHVQQRVLARPVQAEEFDALKDDVSDPNDTHPSTAERIQALAVSGDEALGACLLPEQVAGAIWLADWDAVVGRHNALWRDQNASVWRQEHIRQRCQRQRLDALRATGDTSLMRAQLELEYGEPETVMGIARSWLDDPALAGHARYLLGAAQLKAGDKAGVASLEACIKVDPLWALPARDLIAQNPSLLETEIQRHRNQTLLDRARDKRGRALGVLVEKLQQGELAPAALDDGCEVILRDVFAGSPAVAAAWCAEIDELVHDKRSYRAVVLVLRLRTERLLELGLSEDEVRDEARSLLGGLLPGSTLRLVWTVYTTEPLSPELDARLTGWALSGESCCLVPPKADESVGPGARAAALR